MVRAPGQRDGLSKSLLDVRFDLPLEITLEVRVPLDVETHEPFPLPFERCSSNVASRARRLVALIRTPRPRRLRRPPHQETYFTLVSSQVRMSFQRFVWSKVSRA